MTSAFSWQNSISLCPALNRKKKVFPEVQFLWESSKQVGKEH